MVREEGPGVEGGPRGDGDLAQPRHERMAILAIGHDPPLLHPAEYHIMADVAGSIQSRLPGHCGSAPPLCGERSRTHPLSQQRPVICGRE